MTNKPKRIEQISQKSEYFRRESWRVFGSEMVTLHQDLIKKESNVEVGWSSTRSSDPKFIRAFADALLSSAYELETAQLELMASKKVSQ